MTDIQTILKLNGLNCLLFGAFMVFIPKSVIVFLSTTDPASEVMILILGMILNIYGMLLLWLANKQQPNKKLIKLIALGDFIWVLFSFGLIFSKTWITSTSGTTTAGLVAILVGWFGWLQWQHSNI